jgi:co-chaperonin GroES (HSP10)
MLKAINDVVIIQRDKYDGKLIINEKMAHGIIQSIGPGRWKANVKEIKPDGSVQERWYPTSLKPGQRVCFSLDKGEEHKINGQSLVIMREDDIAAVIESDVYRPNTCSAASTQLNVNSTHLSGLIASKTGYDESQYC